MAPPRSAADASEGGANDRPHEEKRRRGAGGHVAVRPFTPSLAEPRIAGDEPALPPSVDRAQGMTESVLTFSLTGPVDFDGSVASYADHEAK